MATTSDLISRLETCSSLAEIKDLLSDASYQIPGISPKAVTLLYGGVYNINNSDFDTQLSQFIKYHNSLLFNK
ncbi:MAG: hypothetical protein HQL69_22150 [Magnetococcales bacterium]|nr:hypothetical protein [Magnetococcales bacterium]